MAMELQLRTGRANQQIRNTEKALQTLSASINRLSQQTGQIQAVMGALQGFKGFNPQVISSVAQLSDGLAKLPKGGTLASVNTQLNKLSKINISKTADGITKLAAALRTLKVPPGMAALSQVLTNLSTATSKANTSIRKLNAALRATKAPAGLAKLATQLNKVGQQARSARQGISGLGTATSTATGLLAGFGVALGGVGIAQFIQGSISATRTVDAFKAAMGTFEAKGLNVKDTINEIRASANSLGTSFSASLQGFKLFASSALTAGKSVETVKETFFNFQKVASGLKLSGQQVDRVFLALSQTFNKGKLQSQELVQQLGDVIPGAFAVAAQAAGKTGPEMMKAMEQGQVPADTLIKMGRLLAEQFAGATTSAAKTLNAALLRLSNSAFDIQASFGAAFGEVTKGAINSLANTLNSVPFQTFAANAGHVVGVMTNLVVITAKVAAQFPYLTAGIVAFIALGTAGRVLVMAASFSGLSAVLRGVVLALTSARVSALAFGAVSGVITGVSVVLRALGAAAAFASTGFLPMAIVIGGATAAIAALIAVVSGALSAEDAFAGITKTLGQAFAFAKGTAAALTGQTGQLSGAANAAGKGMATTGTEAKKADNAMAGISESAADATGGLGKLTTAASQTAGPLGTAATAATELSTAAVKVGPAASSATAGMGAAASAANQLAQAYRNAAAAARELASSQGGGGSGTASVGSGSGGGYSHALPNSQNVPMDVFRNAPQLAGGTANTNNLGAGSLPGGGIPAVLHSNEAVVPLAGGGTIPIAGNMGGPSAIDFRILETMGDVLTEVTRGTSVLNTHATTFVEQTRITHNKLDMMYERQGEFFGAWKTNTDSLLVPLNAVSKKLSELKTTISNLSSSGSSSSSSGGGSSSSSGGSNGGSGVFSSGGDLGGGGGVGDVFQNFLAASQEQKSALDSLRGKPFIKGRFTAGARVYLSAADRAADAQAFNLIGEKRTALLQGFQELPGVKIEKGAGFNGPTYKYTVPDALFRQLPAEIRRLDNVIPQSGNKVVSAPQLAKGTANTSDELAGLKGRATTGGKGSPAILHPNEAVIPLDGNRKVPVSLNLKKPSGKPAPRSSASAIMTEQANESGRPNRSRNTNSGSNNGGTTIQIQMTVIAKDAESFRRNNDQIVQELGAKLNRAKANLGDVNVVDDPTSFLRKKERR